MAGQLFTFEDGHIFDQQTDDPLALAVGQ
jgi:hypothetical protein